MQFKDYYQTLGVEKTATAAAVKTAYRRLVRKYHPDVSKEADAETKIKSINEAYEVLGDAEKRAEYDQLAARGYRPGDEVQSPGGAGFEYQGDGDFSDFFESLFGRGRTRGAAGGRRATRGHDTKATLSIELATAFSGGSERVTVGGKTIDVKIPAGILPGKSIRLSGMGGAGQGGPAGDLLLEIQIKAHRQFELDGKDVIVNLPVAPWEAANGAAIAVPTLAGKVELRIPEGSASGKKLRLRGRGMPGTPAGDQYVIVQVQAPAPENKAQSEAYEALQKAFPDGVRKNW